MSVTGGGVNFYLKKQSAITSNVIARSSQNLEGLLETWSEIGRYLEIHSSSTE